MFAMFKSRWGSTEICAVLLLAIVVLTFLFTSTFYKFQHGILSYLSSVLSISLSSRNGGLYSEMKEASGVPIATVSTLGNVTEETDVVTDLSPLALIKQCNESMSDSYSSDTLFNLRPYSSNTPLMLADYVDWHKRERECLRRTLSSCDGSVPRVLVWRCFTMLCGGVGDRMRGIRFVFLLSILTRRLFFIDWPKRFASPYPLTIALLPASIDWRVPGDDVLKRLTSRGNVRSVSVVCESLGQGARTSEEWANNTIRMNIVPNSTNFNDLWKEFDVVYLTNRMSRSAVQMLCDNPCFDNENLSEMYCSQISLVQLERMLMQTLFTPSPHVQALASARVGGMERGSYVAVHARTGVDMGEGRGERLGYIASHLSEAAARLLRCVKSMKMKNMTIFVASDSQTLKSDFLELARTERNIDVKTEDRRSLHIDRRSSARKVRKERVYSKKGYWLHVDRTSEGYLNRSKVKDDGNICLGFFDVFADLFALADAKVLVHYASGFAATAQSFGRHDVVRELVDVDAGRAGECAL